ncbi:hypothetical protein [Pseudomonas gingeri]|uniref:hypothetical protein n=1 Tax=Pseudomonas gingeri TaxID=117681 RepID=UPI00159FDA29|nr:hypothetical protein [Pseudomonas gingeri]NWA03717.1 hypothetical protein [Pseudomonas gingeri]NWA14576.1 hypothetical protein [Pseudomonas gingeri]NWA54806.1 hypothetical protein [Pseudomonas gingeri]NWA94530.1 hypothetical protein [Pseudomonas gingeri]NWB01186.1 hypothetical protein [Pseudomonas gingeri]
MKQVLLLAALALLGGCASETKYKANMDSWVGQDEVRLVRELGPPMQAYEAGGSRFLVYTMSNSLVIPGTPTTASTGNYGNGSFTTITPGAPAQSLDYTCSSQFEVKGQKVVAWTSRGNGCVAE